jgi:hypothetical protein
MDGSMDGGKEEVKSGSKAATEILLVNRLELSSWISGDRMSFFHHLELELRGSENGSLKSSTFVSNVVRRN